jgi:hypothetical protein
MSSIAIWRCIDSALRAALCGMAVMATFVHAARAQIVTLEVSGVIEKLSGSCSPYAEWCDFTLWHPSPQFVATYPIGMPLTITHTVDLAAPDTTADPLHGFYSAAMSTKLEIAGNTYEFNPGWVRVDLDQGNSVVYDYSRFSAERSVSPFSTVPEILNWSVTGEDVYADDSIPISPRGAFDARGAVSFSNRIHVLFNVTNIRQIPEPSTWAIVVGSAALVTLGASRARNRNRRI